MLVSTYTLKHCNYNKRLRDAQSCRWYRPLPSAVIQWYMAPIKHPVHDSNHAELHQHIHIHMYIRG